MELVMSGVEVVVDGRVDRGASTPSNRQQRGMRRHHVTVWAALGLLSEGNVYTATQTTLTLVWSTKWSGRNGQEGFI